MGDKVVAGVADDMGEGMQCVDHPYRSNPGGVCAFCLQEKLGKLVSSSKSSPFFPLQPPPSSSSSSPTSFRSDAGAGGGGLGLASGHSRAGAGAGGRRNKFPFLAASHSKKKKSSGGGGYGNGGTKVLASVSTAASFTAASAMAVNDSGIVLKRSKSVAPRTAGGLAQGGGGRIGDPAVADSPRKKSFWSFLYLSPASSTTTSSSSAANNSSGSSSNINRRRSTSSFSGGGCDRDVSKQQQQTSASDKLVGKEEAATAAPRRGENAGEEAESPSGSQASSSFGRQVARSRSVGCGSRSFSGDFLERISTGFGDCTLRRVESQREAKPKIVLHLDHDNDGNQQRPRMKERVKCGGFFGGFGMMSAYWLSAAAAADDDFDSSSRTPAASATAAVRGGATPHGRNRSWALAFASPMRVFRPYSSSKSPYAINNVASAAPAVNVMSSINASNKMANGGGGSKGNKLDGKSSFLAVQSQ